MTENLGVKLKLLAINVLASLLCMSFLIYLSIYMITTYGSKLSAEGMSLLETLQIVGVSSVGDYIFASLPSGIIMSEIIVGLFLIKPLSKREGLSGKDFMVIKTAGLVIVIAVSYLAAYQLQNTLFACLGASCGV